jgi:hypothetical protein
MCRSRYFKHLAGLQQSDAGRGWQHLKLHPQVFSVHRNQSICGNLSSTQASIVTPRGVLAGAWACGEGGGGTACSVRLVKQLSTHGTCVEGKTFDCSGASMWIDGCRGTFVCNGQAVTCSIDGPGRHLCPCPGGDTSGPTLFTYSVTIPVGSLAEVILPKMGMGAKVVIQESGHQVWANGHFVGAAIAGLSSATALEHEVRVAAGSGSYTFTVHSPAYYRSGRLKTDDSALHSPPPLPPPPPPPPPPLTDNNKPKLVVYYEYGLLPWSDTNHAATVMKEAAACGYTEMVVADGALQGWKPMDAHTAANLSMWQQHAEALGISLVPLIYPFSVPDFTIYASSSLGAYASLMENQRCFACVHAALRA